MAPPTDIAKMIADYRREHDGVREAREHQLQLVLQDEIAKLSAMLPLKQQQKQQQLLTRGSTTTTTTTAPALSNASTATFPHAGSITGMRNMSLSQHQIAAAGSSAVGGSAAVNGVRSSVSAAALPIAPANQSALGGSLGGGVSRPSTTAEQQPFAGIGGKPTTTTTMSGGTSTTTSPLPSKENMIAEFQHMFGPKVVPQSTQQQTQKLQSQSQSQQQQQQQSISGSAAHMEQQRRQEAMLALKQMYAH